MGPITDAHKLTYKENVLLAVQQKKPKLESSFTYADGLSGRISMMMELIGATEPVLDLGRKADTPDIDALIEPVWIKPRQIAWGKLIEKEDAIKALTDYQSQFVQNGAAAMIRGVDRVRRDAFFAPRQIGQDGTTVSAWNGKTVGVGVGYSATDDTTAAPMNVRKVLRARRQFSESDIDLGEEEIFMGLNSQQIEELFRDLTFISADYRDRKVLDQPERIDILNVTIVPALDGKMALPDYDANTYTGAIWCKSGMHWGPFDPMTVNVPLRADKMLRPHPQMEHWVGAARSEDVKVQKILSKK